MALRLNDAFRHSKLGALAGTWILEIYSGAQPAAGGAASGTLLGTVTAITWAAASGGERAVSASTDGTAAASGTAGWGRFSTDAGATFFDGAVGAEFTLADTNIVENGTISLTSATYTQPAA